MGESLYPSAGYATIDADGAVGAIHIAAAGLGPADGFTSYKAFVGDPPRTRWGDYGAALTDGANVWIAVSGLAAQAKAGSEQAARKSPKASATSGSILPAGSGRSVKSDL